MGTACKIVCICIYVHIHTHIHVVLRNIYIYIYIHTHICTPVNICFMSQRYLVQPWAQPCKESYVYLYIYIYIYIYTYTHTYDRCRTLEQKLAQSGKEVGKLKQALEKANKLNKNAFGSLKAVSDEVSAKCVYMHTCVCVCVCVCFCT